MTERTTEKPEECERCSHATTKLTFYASTDCRGGNDPTFVRDDTPPSMRPRWLCRICEVTPGVDTVALHPALNLILEAAERRHGIELQRT